MKDTTPSPPARENQAAKAAHDKCMDVLKTTLNQAIPQSDMDRREKLAIPAKEEEYINSDYSDEDQEIPPDNAGAPSHNGTSSFFKFELLENNYDKEVSWLIKGYIPADSIGVIYGASMSFKSFHAINWAASIATGREWNGRKVTKAAVLYIAAEGGIGAARRARGWSMTYNNSEEIDLLYSVKSPIFIGSPQQVSGIINTVRRIEEKTGEKIGVIFLDTLARCFGGADENKTSDMNMFIAACDLIKSETGATLIIVHHTGKDDKKEARGSSSLVAGCDFVFKIQRNEKDMLYALNCHKMKDDAEPDTSCFDMQERFLFHDKDGDEVTTLVASSVKKEGDYNFDDDDEPKPSVKLTSNHEVVLQAIRSRTAKKEPATKALIRDDLKAQGVKTNNYARWIQVLIEKGCIKQDGENLIPVNLGQKLIE